MLYDAYGRQVEERAARPPRPGMWAVWEPSDDQHLSAVARGLTPEKVDAVMQAADSGDTARMCALAEQIDDRSFGIGAALDTRRAAVAATPWRLEPGDESSRADDIATAAEQMLRQTHPGNELLTYQQMVQLELGSALLPGFAAPEIVWAKGGTEIRGFNSVPQKHFTFIGSRMPLLTTTNRPEGIPLEPAKWVLHWHRAKGGAPTRGGLIRVCAWLRSFEAVTMKDLLRFAERYGMPFLTAKVDEQTWQSERTVLKSVIRNFGPDGGAVFGRGTELDLLQAANNTGEVFFRLGEYLEKAAEKLILGQTATSGDGGWSNSGAQHLVRMDIRDSDCSQIAETVYARILVHWTAWNYGPAAPVPRVVYDITESKDTQAEADTIKTLSEAGYRLDPEQVEANTGYRVEVTTPGPAWAVAGGTGADGGGDEGAVALAAEGMHDDGNAAAQAVQVPDRIAAAALPRGRTAAGTMLGPLQQRLDAIAGIGDDDEFRRACAALSAELPQMMTDEPADDLSGIIADTIRAAAAAGMAERAGALSTRTEGAA